MLGEILDSYRSLPLGWRVAAVLLAALAGHLALRGLRRATASALAPGVGPGVPPGRRFPKLATLATVLESALTFAVYFGAVGVAVTDLGVPLTAYLASASVIGLAVGFGSQGLVQDLVSGLTLVFSDVLEVGDVVDLGGRIGRVERIGLRFTVLSTLRDQRVYVPNREIGQIGRYPGGWVGALADLQVPDGVEEDAFVAAVDRVVRGLHAQHPAAVVASPELVGVHPAGAGGWRYLRVRFRLWPGQRGPFEALFAPRALAAVRELAPDYQGWMIAMSERE